ncbi:MAG TPA: YitT family protein [Tissierellaceae bacterium]
MNNFINEGCACIMSSVRDVFGDRKEIIRKLFFILMGNLFCSTAINLFFVPNGLLSGGVGGLGIIVQYLTGIPTGITVFVLNLPIFLMGYRILNKKFLVYAFISMFAFSSILTATKDIGTLLVVDDILLASIFGGVFNGIGMGLMFRNGVCQGGFDVVAAILKKKQNINIGSGLMMVNTIIITLSSLLFGYKRAMYTLIAMYIGYQVLDKVQIGLNVQKNVIIVSDKSQELSSAIMEKINRGVTLLKGEGAYTKEKKDIIYCTLTSREIARLKELVNEIDPMAFLTIYDVVEVKGKGFKSAEI